MKTGLSPSLVLTLLLTKQVIIQSEQRERYWFEWSKRRDRGLLTLTVELIDLEGNALAQLVTNLERAGEAKNKWVMMETPPNLHPARFRYQTSKLLLTSAWASGKLLASQEDSSGSTHSA